MKKLIVFILSSLILSCNQKMQDDANVCEKCINSYENLHWLKELIQKAETDKTGNYLGCIWLEKTNDGKDIFVTNMMLGSGGVMYWYFDCCGNHYAFAGVEKCVACEYVGNNHIFFDDDFSMSEMKKDVIIYSPQNLQHLCE